MYKTIIIFSTILCLANATHTKIKLADVKALTLKAGQQTTARRTSPAPQLACHGYNCKYAPDTVQCTNKGTDGEGIQWECKADIPSSLSLKTDYVSCEGYENANDHYILVGSCSLTYSLVSNGSHNTQSDNGFITLGAFMLVAILVCGHGGYGRGYGRGYGGGYGGGYGRGWGGGGFWSGAAGGALAAHALNRNHRRRGGGRNRGCRHTSRGFCGTRNR